MMDLYRSLGGRHHAGHSRIQFQRHAQRATKRLEYGFGLMVCIVSSKIVDMHRHQSMVDESLKKLLDQINIELANVAAHEFAIEYQAGTAGYIHHHP